MTKTTAKTTKETTATEALNTGAKVAADSTKAVTGFLSALAQSGRKTVEGVVEVDKTLFGFAKDAVNAYIAHGKASLNAKNVNELLDIQAAYAHASIETGVANTREVIDLARAKAEEAYAPVKSAVTSAKDRKAA